MLDNEIVKLLIRNTKNIFVSSIDVPTSDSTVNLPLLLITQTINEDLDERNEVLLENNVLKMIQQVNFDGSILTITNRETALVNTPLTVLQLASFLPKWQDQQIVALEYRLFNKNKTHLFSIGAVWDSLGRSWVFEPHSRNEYIWEIDDNNKI